MQPLRSILAAGGAALVLTLSAAPPPDSYGRLRQLFPNPPVEYRPAPLWAWNGDTTEAEIRAQLLELSQQGIGGVFIHPRPGMVTEYLSDRWFELCRYTLDEAKKLGMQVWMYDENSWPSGFAGGHVPAEMPESYNGGQGLLLHRLDRLSQAEAGKCRILLKKPGEYYCFEVIHFQRSNYYGGFSYVDLLRPGVTEKFISLTMPGYERALGSEFGKAVPGIFTDEPRVTPPTRKNCIRWTPDLFEQFERRWGYDVRPRFASLFDETGDWRKIRHDYYATLLELFIERWSKPWFNYTKAKKLHWTGHYWEHDWPSPMHGVDNMAMYAWHQVPGIDMLFNQFRHDVDAQFGNVRSVKELSSVANQLGRRRTLSESYAGSGWELRFEDMKRLGDWEFGLGVNLLCLHDVQMTIVGARKYDFPQSFSYQEPWWKYFRTLGDYFARLSLALSAGEQVNRILIIEPTTSAWMHASATNIDPGMMDLGKSFQAFITRLEDLQGKYDLGSEDIIKDHGKTAGGRFLVGRRAYDLVVLPPGTENLEGSTAKLLQDYMGQGGTVLSFAGAPARVDGAHSDLLPRLSARHAARWLRARSLDDPVAKERLLTSGFEQVSGELLHHRRQLTDGQLLFFANSSLTQPARAMVAVNGRSAVRLDLLKGSIGGYSVRRTGRRLSIPVDLPPGGSLLLAVTDEAPAHAPPEARREERVVPPAGRTPPRRLAPNVLTIDYCDLKLGGTIESELPLYTASEKVFRYYGFGTNPWTAIQYKTRFFDKGRFSADSGFEAMFHFDVNESVDTSGMQAAVEQPELWQVSINGVAVRNRPGEWWVDRHIGVYDIGGHVLPGGNTLTLVARPMSVRHELERVYILGQFGLQAQEKGWKLAPAGALTTGAWKDQGLPFYSEAVAYGARYALRPGAGKYKVRLGRWNGTVAEVRVNGKPAGIVGWQPYELDISGFLRNGENQIQVVVCGSLKNLLGPHHGKIDRGLVSPLSFRSAPQRMPPGKQYDLDAYGLFEDFQVIERIEKH